MQTKKGWKALLLNLFIPGLGQVYARKITKGIVLYILFFVSVLNIRYISFSFPLFVVAISIIFIYFTYVLINGYRSVEKGKAYKPNKFDKWYFYGLIIIAHTFVINALHLKTLDEITPINFASIPTASMAPALQVGDVLAFKKVEKVNRGEIIIFRHPDEIGTLYIKRCIGMPGNSLQIKNGLVYINDDTLKNTYPLKYKYIIFTNGKSINPRLFEELKIDEHYKIGIDNYLAHLTLNQAKELRKLALIKEVEISIKNNGEGDIMIFPDTYKERWNADFYGKIYIPKKGDTIELTKENLSLYSKIIRYENEFVTFNDSFAIIEGKEIKQYEIQNNYYFMMGDSRHNSLDSRYWGFLPENLVVGRAMYLYWSKSFDRIGKEII